MAKQVEKREQRREVDAGDWVETYGMGSNHYLRVPSGVSLFNPRKPDTWFLEFMPYDVGDFHLTKQKGDYYFTKPIKVHRVPGTGGDSPVFACLKMWREDCCVCGACLAYGQDPKRKALSDAIRAKDRDLWLPFVHEEANKKVQVFDISKHLFGKYLQAKITRADPDMRPKYQKFADPDKGMTVRIVGVEKSTGEGRKPCVEYPDIEFRERKSPVPDKFLKHGICLDDLVIKTPNDVLTKEFLLDGGTTYSIPPGAGRADDQEPAGWGGDDTPSARSREAEPDPQPPSRPEPAASVSSNGDSGGDDGWDAAPEKPKEELVIAKGETYSFEYEGKVITGDVVDINRAKNLAKVKSPDREGHYVVDLSQLQLPEPKSAKTQPPPAEDGWGEEVPQETTPKRGKK